MKTLQLMLTKLAWAGAFTLLLAAAPLSANGSTPVADPEPVNVASDAPAATAKPAEPHNPSCEPGTDDRTSDLCAQWKAADSAASSALWAERGFWITLLGTIALLATLILNARATSAATKASEAAEKSLAAAQQQLRAYLDFDPPVEYAFAAESKDGLASFDLLIRVTNHGSTHATAIEFTHKFVIAAVTPTLDELKDATWRNGGSLAQDCSFNFEAKANKEIAWIQPLKDKTAEFYCIIAVKYKDAFGGEHFRAIVFGHDGGFRVRNEFSQLSDIKIDPQQ